MAARANDDETATVNPVEALTYSFLEFSEIYANLFDSDKSELVHEMGKTLRCISKSLRVLGAYLSDANEIDDDSLFDNEE
jgi:hypothetical protein